MNLIQDQTEIDNWDTSNFLPVRGMATETPTPTVTATATDTAVPTATSTPTAPNGDAHYFYDGDSNLVLSIIDDVTTYYPNSSYEKRVEGGTEMIYKYYFTGSTRIAMRENETISWLLGDHLGSTSVTVDASGNLLSSVKYTAFGEIRTGNSSTDYQYTGQRNEVEIGLYYYVARFYDPQLARFISADTLVPEPGNLKSYDRYGYVNGNPIRFNDPSGHRSCSDTDDFGKCIDDGWKPSSMKNPKKSTSTSVSTNTSLRNNSTISEGTIYTSTWVIPYSEMQELKLSTKAEETYTGGYPPVDYSKLSGLARAITSVNDSVSIWSDFQGDVTKENIFVEVNWQEKNAGLYLQDITIKNYSHAFLMLRSIDISSFRYQNQILGPNYIVGLSGDKPGQIDLDINPYLSKEWDSIVHIQFAVTAYPKDRYIELFFPAGILPNPGCSIIK